MSGLDIEGVLAAEYVTLSEGTVGGNWQRERVAHVAAVLREQIVAAQAEALRAAADEAAIRGDIGRPGQIEVWDWLRARAAARGAEGGAGA